MHRVFWKECFPVPWRGDISGYSRSEKLRSRPVTKGVSHPFLGLSRHGEEDIEVQGCSENPSGVTAVSTGTPFTSCWLRKHLRT